MTVAEQSPLLSAETQRPLAELQHVSLRYGDANGTKGKQVLNDVSLQIHPGELLVLVGMSGCGKTTVLNIFAGLIQPTSGNAYVLGRPPREHAGSVAYMFARDALLPWRTARRNVELILELRGTPRQERREAASRLLGSLGLSEATDKYPWQLSQGMRQRVALARTWVQTPSLILMDEPFAALDAQTRGSVQAEFLDMWTRTRPGALFVTHDISEALVLADRILVMGDGVVRAEYPVPFGRAREMSSLVLEPEFQRLLKAITNDLT